MPAPLASRLDALARERDGYLDVLEGLTPEARTRRPAPEAWSPLEIAEHVFRVERAMLRGLEKQSAAGDARTGVGARSAVRVAALVVAMRTPRPIRMPQGTRGIAPEGMAYEALRTEWASLPARWEAATAALPASLSAAPLLKHPIAGALTLGDALRFLVAHAARHRRQLARSVRAAPAPPSGPTRTPS